MHLTTLGGSNEKITGSSPLGRAKFRGIKISKANLNPPSRVASLTYAQRVAVTDIPDDPSEYGSGFAWQRAFAGVGMSDTGKRPKADHRKEICELHQPARDPTKKSLVERDQYDGVVALHFIERESQRRSQHVLNAILLPTFILACCIVRPRLNCLCKGLAAFLERHAVASTIRRILDLIFRGPLPTGFMT